MCRKNVTKENTCSHLHTVHSPAVLLDTKGPEIRSGFFEEGVDKVTLKKGALIILTTDYNFRGNEKKLACSYPQLCSSVTPGQQILVADGSLVLTVVSLDLGTNEATCRFRCC